MMNSFTQLVQQIKSADYANANQTFAEIMQQKVADRLQQERQTIFTGDSLSESLGSSHKLNARAGGGLKGDQIQAAQRAKRNKNVAGMLDRGSRQPGNCPICGNSKSKTEVVCGACYDLAKQMGEG
jgi:hypothetical protein